MQKITKKFVPFILIAFLGGLTGYAVSPGSHLPHTSINLGELKAHLLAYKKTGRYDRELTQINTEAMAYIDERAYEVARPALVLDIDETALSNWPVIEANDFGYIASGFNEWIMQAKSEAIPSTLSLYQAAKAKGVAIFFITGRDETLRHATEKNLKEAGYTSWTGLIMRPAHSVTPSAADYKIPACEKIATQGYTIIANIGDQPSDLACSHAERIFLLPNPFYRIP